jgi:hypothetical protein
VLNVTFRRVGPAKLTLVQRNGSADVDITVRLSPANTWQGVVSFPIDMVGEAMNRVSEVETANDLEDLVRAWSDKNTWASFQEFRNVNEF